MSHSILFRRTFISLALALFFLTFTCYSGEGKRVGIPEGTFIDKEYDGLSRDNSSIHYCKKNGNDYDMMCRTQYYKKDLIEGFVVIITQFKDIDDAVERMYTSYSLSGGKPKFGKGNKSKYSNYRDGGIGSITWISGNAKISMSGNNCSVPQEAIEDYMAKYPPTYTFRPENMNAPQKMMKKFLNKRMDAIMEVEKERLKNKDKEKQYRTIIAQCLVELPVRCQMGLVNEPREADCPESFCYRRGSRPSDAPTTDCPAAMEMDDRKRGEMWKEIRRVINTRDVVLENVQPTFKHHNCEMLYGRDQLAFQALLLIEADQIDLMGIPDDILPAMSKRVKRAYLEEVERRKADN